MTSGKDASPPQQSSNQQNLDLETFIRRDEEKLLSLEKQIAAEAVRQNYILEEKRQKQLRNEEQLERLRAELEEIKADIETPVPECAQIKEKEAVQTRLAKWKLLKEQALEMLNDSNDSLDASSTSTSAKSGLAETSFESKRIKVTYPEAETSVEVDDEEEEDVEDEQGNAEVQDHDEE